MITSFGDLATEEFFHGKASKRARRYPVDSRRTAIRKLDMLNAAHDLLDLRSPPGNRLEGLRGNLKGMHSIRINDQWRIVFRWRGSDAEQVKIVDYRRG